MSCFMLKYKRKEVFILLSPLVYANTIIRRALQMKIPISSMKLQKLLYFLYARYLYLYQAPLFADNFEKWQYGPVVSEVYHAFHKYGANPITDFAQDRDGKVYLVDEKNEKFMKCFDEVWGKFHAMSGWELSSLTHDEGTAWSKATGQLLPLDAIQEDGRRFFEYSP